MDMVQREVERIRARSETAEGSSSGEYMDRDEQYYSDGYGYSDEESDESEFDDDDASADRRHDASSNSSDAVYGRLCDPKSFTGAHKHRFDHTGRGLGLAGRDSIIKGAGWSPVSVYSGGSVQDISQIMRNRGAKAPGSPGRSPRRSPRGSEARVPPGTFFGTPPRAKRSSSDGGGSVANTPHSPSTSKTYKSKSDIFDRLTDPREYTGHHKHRFDRHGNGRGLAGRDYITKGHGTAIGRANSGEVRDIAQLMRSRMPPKDTNGGVHSPRPGSAPTRSATSSSSQESGKAKKKKKKKKKKKQPAVFKKLTDTTQYTGHHRQVRFRLNNKLRANGCQ
eukprot:COSAG05_NODE_541_length_8832_cov_190.458491_8_plen_336_part_00